MGADPCRAVPWVGASGAEADTSGRIPVREPTREGAGTE